MRLREALQKYDKVTPSRDHDFYFIKVKGSYICRAKHLQEDPDGKFYAAYPGITIDTIIDCEERESWEPYPSGLLFESIVSIFDNAYNNSNLDKADKLNIIGVMKGALREIKVECKRSSAIQKRLLNMLERLYEESKYVFIPVKGSLPLDGRMEEFGVYLKIKLEEIMQDVEKINPIEEENAINTL